MFQRLKSRFGSRDRRQSIWYECGNALSKPFKTTSGWNVIYVPAKREAKDRSFTQMKGSVLRKIKNERVKEMYENYTNGLRQGVNVSIDDAKVEECGDQIFWTF